MKKVIFFILIFCVFCSLKGIGKSEMPDPLNITYPPSDEESLETKVEKPNDPRTLEEKFRDKFHLKPSKKIYLHNIDRSSQPVTVEDYLAMAKDKKRADFIIPEPVFNHDPKYIVISESPHYRVVRFNNPPGQRNIDVSQLINNRTEYYPPIIRKWSIQKVSFIREPPRLLQPLIISPLRKIRTHMKHYIKLM